MVHWYPKMGVVKESGRGQLKNFPARKRADQHIYISPPTRKHLLTPLYCGNLPCARVAKRTVEVILVLVEEIFKIVDLN